MGDRKSTYIKHPHLEKIQKGEVWLKGSTIKSNSDLQEVDSFQVRKKSNLDQINDQAEIDEENELEDETIVEEALAIDQKSSPKSVRHEKESIDDEKLVRLNSQSQKASIDNMPEI